METWTPETIVRRLVPAAETEEALSLLRRCATSTQTFDYLSFLLARSTGELSETPHSFGQTQETKTEFTNTEFKCPSCGKRQCTTWEKQTRSLDEGATLFAKCVCGRVWRPSG